MAAEAHFSALTAKEYNNINCMIIFLYGEDSYRTKQKLEDIVLHYKKVHKSGLNLIKLDAKEKDFKDFFNSLKTVSMFAEKKLIILKNIFSDTKFQDDFLKEIKNLNDLKDIIVIYEKESVDQRNKLFKTLKKDAKCQEFKLLDNKLLKAWMLKEFENYKTKIEPMAENLLLDYVGNDLWKLQNEIKKLAWFKAGLPAQAGKIIKKEDVELLIKPKIETDIFKTIDALAERNKKQALLLLHKHLENGDNSLYLLSMMEYQFKNLLIIKELIEKRTPYAVISKNSGLHPFVVKKTYQQAKNFSFQGLKKIYQRIFEVDLSIKTGKVEPETALDLLIAEV